MFIFDSITKKKTCVINLKDYQEKCGIVTAAIPPTQATSHTHSLASNSKTTTTLIEFVIPLTPNPL